MLHGGVGAKAERPFAGSAAAAAAHLVPQEDPYQAVIPAKTGSLFQSGGPAMGMAIYAGRGGYRQRRSVVVLCDLRLPLITANTWCPIPDGRQIPANGL